MQHYICTTCGIQYAATETEPEQCIICEDDRQYVNQNGQQWTTLATLQQERHNVFTELESGLTAIGTVPEFAIGQNTHLIQSAHGNILWESISLIDEQTIETIQHMGGASAIAISHPHFYDAMVEWSHALGKIPIYLHSSNREWVMRPDEVIHYWDGETFPINPDLTLIRCGGHFPGSSVLHWNHQGGRLFTGDTITVVQDRRYVSFMYSYPNLIPLAPAAIQQIVDAIEPFSFERLYGSWHGKVVVEDAKQAVKRSAERYIRHITAL